MKNIHLIPTDKPSRLYEFGGEYHLQIKSQENFRSQHIYITSSEEIKEGHWFLNEINETETGIRHYDYKTLSPECKKIILTTDQDLIKDGVQPIDDTFLEWFVKNPSCESVEVKKITYPSTKGFLEGKPLIIKNIYKIIIPQEEPKQEWLKNAKWGVRLTKDKQPDFTYVDQWFEGKLFKRDMLKLVYPDSPSFSYSSWKVFDTKELAEEWIKVPKKEPKQETLEEAAKLYIGVPIDRIIDGEERYYTSNISEYDAFIAGAKWQQERMYSEEDLKQFAFECVGKFLSNDDNKVEIKLVDVIIDRLNKHFEQFKKK
jgi:hypothetical protein